MSRKKPTLETRLTAAIGILYAEVRTKTVVSPAERQAQFEVEDLCQTLLNSPLLVKRLAELTEGV